MKIDCKRQFTSELMKLQLPIRDKVPDETADREEPEHRGLGKNQGLTFPN